MDFDDYIAYKMTQDDGDSSGSGVGCGTQLAAILVILAVLSVIGSCG